MDLYKTKRFVIMKILHFSGLQYLEVELVIPY